MILDRTHVDEIECLVRNLAQFKWDTPTPWRLAVDRLDDAVFKLECRSPDAILDIVIGLEAVLTESENRQESTHKVAIRAARYLEETVHGRREVFRLVKQAYKARSALAHGQVWELGEDDISNVDKAARILARLLGRMARKQQWELDLTELDLS